MPTVLVRPRPWDRKPQVLVGQGEGCLSIENGERVAFVRQSRMLSCMTCSHGDGVLLWGRRGPMCVYITDGQPRVVLHPQLQEAGEAGKPSVLSQPLEPVAA